MVKRPNGGTVSPAKPTTPAAQRPDSAVTMRSKALDWPRNPSCACSTALA